MYIDELRFIQRCTYLRQYVIGYSINIKLMVHQYVYIYIYVYIYREVSMYILLSSCRNASSYTQRLINVAMNVHMHRDRIVMANCSITT